MTPPNSITDNDAGYSLVEAAVALALLLTVAAPLGAVCIQHLRSVEHHAVLAALAIAQADMEHLRRPHAAIDRDSVFDDGPWRVTHRVQRRGNLVSIEIILAHTKQPNLSMVLATEHLRRPHDTP